MKYVFYGNKSFKDERWWCVQRGFLILQGIPPNKKNCIYNDYVIMAHIIVKKDSEKLLNWKTSYLMFN